MNRDAFHDRLRRYPTGVGLTPEELAALAQLALEAPAEAHAAVHELVRLAQAHDQDPSASLGAGRPCVSVQPLETFRHLEHPPQENLGETPPEVYMPPFTVTLRWTKEVQVSAAFGGAAIRAALDQHPGAEAVRIDGVAILGLCEECHTPILAVTNLYARVGPLQTLLCLPCVRHWSPT